MGGDKAPAATVAGAALAAGRWGVDVLLVGREEALRPHLDQVDAQRLTVVEAPEVISMDEDPMAGVRAKRGASVRVACQLVADGLAGAVVSAGATGATLAAALLTMGRLPGVRRPVVAAVVPVGDGGRVVLADAGGSMDVHPEALVGYAAMAGAYARVLGAADPTVGLLNVGEEPGKGNALAKDAFEMLSALPSFAGNVEPPAIFAGSVDVVVTDGFTGNVFLKTVEALGAGQARTKGAGVEERDTAAILLGINGEVLVAHGAAGAEDVALAVRRGAQVAAAGLAQQVGVRLFEQKEGVTDDGRGEEVLSLLSERITVVLGLDGQAVTADTRFDEDLHADSLDLVEVVESVEKALHDRGYALTVNDDALLAATTVGQAADSIAAGLADGSGG